MKKAVKNLLWLIPLIIAALMYFVLPYFPQFTESFITGGIFKIFSVPFGFLTSLIPFSLTEIFVILAMPLVIFLIVLLIIRLKKSKDKLKTAGKAARGVGWFLSCTVLLYMINHGANFYRLTAAELMEFDTSPKSTEFIKSVCIELATKASEARALCEEDENGIMKFSVGLQEELSRAENGYSKLYDEYPFLWGTVNRGKNVMLSGLWSYTQISGMYFPFFCESNINTDQSPCDIPSTVAHELAHTRGFAREDECNFFSFLSCINSDYPEYRYSGYMLAYTYCANQLIELDYDAWTEVYPLLSEAIYKDINVVYEYWSDFEGEISALSGEINDTFIEVQGVEEGSVSYSLMSELVLAYYDKLWYNN